jgi:hypothetical protein
MLKHLSENRILALIAIFAGCLISPPTAKLPEFQIRNQVNGTSGKQIRGSKPKIGLFNVVQVP